VYYVSCDYGTQNATVFLLWHKIQDGRWLCEKEYYYSGRSEIKQKTDEQYCDDLIKFIDGIKINGMIVDPSAASFIAALRKRGITVIHAKNAVLDGIRFTATLLNKRQILFRPCCKNLIQEFNLYSWKPDTAEDEVIKENDHACDAMRYFCYTHLATSKVGTTNIR
jgi:PBSX family phage terminase large subunit